jgi:hypothetical protein
MGPQHLEFGGGQAFRLRLLRDDRDDVHRSIDPDPALDAQTAESESLAKLDVMAVTTGS